ncbi:hypothetical protein TNIN_169381, partial [Trichonephila inaurata madagascariensis]
GNAPSPSVARRILFTKLEKNEFCTPTGTNLEMKIEKIKQRKEIWKEFVRGGLYCTVA